MANINKVNKGYRIEKMCADELEQEGYLVWKTIRVKFQNIDLWGLFDVVCLAKDGSHFRFVQVKSGYCPNKVKEQIKNLKMPDFAQKEIWQYFPKNNKGKRKGWLKEVVE